MNVTTALNGRPTSKFSIRCVVYDGPDDSHPRLIEPVGRDAELLIKLYGAAERGLTSLDCPTGQRVAHFVHKLRKVHGLAIETRTEEHNGVRFGRYILRSRIAVLRPWEQWP